MTKTKKKPAKLTFDLATIHRFTDLQLDAVHGGTDRSIRFKCVYQG